MKTALIIVSDLHINSTVALCTPTVNLDDGGTYHASRTQTWLWRCWLDFVDQVYKDYQGYRKILIINGDLGELDTQRRSLQLVSLNKATITNLVIDTIEPLVSITDLQLFIRGTAAHTGKSAWLEESIAMDTLKTIRPNPGHEPASHWHYRGVCEGVKVDIAHHANAGGDPWRKGNAALRLAARTIWHYRVARKVDPPNIVMRSHNHQYSDSGGNYETFAFFTRAWTAATEYLYRIGQENSIADIGGHVITCEDGKWAKRDYAYEPKEARQVWKLTL
jgi:hypothetical protein